MDITEIEAKGNLVLEMLDDMTAAIKPMMKADFDREDSARLAYNAIGAARIPIRRGLRHLKELVKQVKGEK